jgi:hypothetical protein
MATVPDEKREQLRRYKEPSEVAEEFIQQAPSQRPAPSLIHSSTFTSLAAFTPRFDATCSELFPTIHTPVMRFSSIVISTLAALATASPNSLARRENVAVTEAIIFAVQADDCDLLKCAAVIASAGCIGASILLGPAGVASALGCTAGGASAVSYSAMRYIRFGMDTDGW